MLLCSWGWWCCWGHGALLHSWLACDLSVEWTIEHQVSLAKGLSSTQNPLHSLLDTMLQQLLELARPSTSCCTAVASQMRLLDSMLGRHFPGRCHPCHSCPSTPCPPLPLHPPLSQPPPMFASLHQHGTFNTTNPNLYLVVPLLQRSQPPVLPQSGPAAAAAAASQSAPRQQQMSSALSCLAGS